METKMYIDECTDLKKEWCKNLKMNKLNNPEIKIFTQNANEYF